MPLFDDKNQIKVNENLENINLLFPDNSAGIQTLDNNPCNKQCCNLNQWKHPNFLNDNIDTTDYSKYVASNINCTYNNKDTGCLCLTQDNFNYLKNRGSNMN